MIANFDLLMAVYVYAIIIRVRATCKWRFAGRLPDFKIFTSHDCNSVLATVVLLNL